MKNSSRTILFLFVSGLVFFLNSCTYREKININNDVFSSNTHCIQQKIALYLEQEYCEYSFSQKRFADKYVFKIGETLCEGTEKMLKAAFSQVVIIKSMDIDISGQGIKAIVIPEIVSSDIVLPEIAWKDAKALIAIKYTFLDLDKKRIIWLDTYQGRGQAKLGTIFSGNRNIKKAMRLAIEDQFLKALNGITSNAILKSL